MNKQNNVPSGGGVVISPNIKKTCAVLTKDGQVIDVKDEKEIRQVIKKLLGR